MVITPYEAFGPVQFGFSKQEVIAAMGHPNYAEEKKLSFGSFKVHFDAFGCNYAELFSSPHIEIAPVVDGDLSVFGEFDVVVQALHQRNYDTRLGPEHLPNLVTDVLCDALGIRLWHATEEYVGIESVCAFRPDVYQRMFQSQGRLP